jgi:hypothetical protein
MDLWWYIFDYDIHIIHINLHINYNDILSIDALYQDSTFSTMLILPEEIP